MTQPRLFMVASGRLAHLPCPRCGHPEAVHTRWTIGRACLDCESHWCSPQIVPLERKAAA